MHRLFGRLYDWGDFNALKTSDPSFTAARNTVALGSRIMEELANTVTNDEELINNALKLCTPTVLAEHAYLADADNSDDNILSRIGRKNFHETTSNFMVNARQATVSFTRYAVTCRARPPGGAPSLTTQKQTGMRRARSKRGAPT